MQRFKWPPHFIDSVILKEKILIASAKPRVRWLLFFVSAILLIIILHSILSIISNSKKARNHSPPIPVVAVEATEGSLPIYLSGLGTVTPFDTVTIRTQVAGQLLRVLFAEGQKVKAGDLLAEIDPRPYEAQLAQFEGQLARDQAFLDNARLDLERYQVLWSQDSISKQTLTAQESLVKQYEGAVRFDQGQIETIKVNLIYTRIVSPIDGRVGLRLIDPGNFVQPADPNGIVVVNQMQPITVLFTLPEDSIPKVIRSFNQGKPMQVQALDRSQNTILSEGCLLTYDNQIDVTTGTLRLKALFQNEDNHLFPNQFVNVRLLVNVLEKTTLVPSAAIQYGSQGNYVYVINDDNTVKSININERASFSGKSSILGNIKPGQKVVIEGTDKLNEGMKVKISDNSTPKPKSPGVST